MLEIRDQIFIKFIACHDLYLTQTRLIEQSSNFNAQRCQIPCVKTQTQDMDSLLFQAQGNPDRLFRSFDAVISVYKEEGISRHRLSKNAKSLLLFIKDHHPAVSLRPLHRNSK